MMRKSVYVKYTDFLIIYQRRNETKKQSYYRHKYLYNKRTFCALFCTLFVHCQSFSQCKKFFSSGNKVFRVDVNFIKEMHFNWKHVLNCRMCFVASKANEKR